MSDTMTYTYLGDGTKAAANRWRYAGKEEQRIAGMDLHLIDFGARYYDPFTCRWNATDPLAHKYFSMSPYNYCGNDPVNFFDPDGRDTWKIGLDGMLVSVKEDSELDCFQIVDEYNNVIKSWGTTAGSFRLNSGIGEFVNYSSNAISSGVQGFEFLAQSTNVEFGAVISSSNFIDSDIMTIATIGRAERCNINSIALNMDKMGFMVFNIIHSHPHDTPPSGFNESYRKGQSDKIARDNMKFENGYPVLMVYRAKSHDYFRYDNSEAEIFDSYIWSESHFLQGTKKVIKR